MSAPWTSWELILVSFERAQRDLSNDTKMSFGDVHEAQIRAFLSEASQMLKMIIFPVTYKITGTH